MVVNPVRYVRVGDKHIAYRAVGAGTQDWCLVLPTLGTIEMLGEQPARRLIEGLASHFRFISFDRRGSGLSDPVEEPATLEEQIDDVVAVLDACASGRTIVSSEVEGAMMAVMFAATHPERVSHLVLTHPMARVTNAPGYDWTWESPEDRTREFTQRLLSRWGTGENAVTASPVMAARDADFSRWWGRWERISASPGSFLKRMQLIDRLDVREILPRVQCPTLIIDRPDAPAMNSKHAEYFAEHIPNARLASLPGRDSISFGDGMDAWMEAVLDFCGSTDAAARTSARTLATVMFTDIVGSTSRAAELGDRRWRETLEGHDRLTRDLVSRYGGKAIKSTGDGFLATFDGPARAVRCAAKLTERVDDLGIQLRAGVHAGEVEMIGADVGGMAVHIGARIGALGGPGEVLASSTVRDLVVGSGIEFSERGEEELKGVPGAWRIYAVAGTGEGE
jgi:class 3 adenylate cyclase/alpha-beta hydrolase superfamily lysophospholipase